MSIISLSLEEPKWNKAEILRYAGVRNDAPDQATQALLGESMEEAKEVLSYNLIYCKLPISRFLDKIDLGFTMSSSEKLSKHLEGCDEIIAFAATLGIGIDRLINKYGKISPAKGVVMQAIGAERIEALCDSFEDMIIKDLSKENKTLRARYSPGYGDFSLGVQLDLFNYLDCQRRIGLTLNDSLLMSPSKSVTAIIGISQQGESCRAGEKRHDCRYCQQENCAFRR